MRDMALISNNVFTIMYKKCITSDQLQVFKIEAYIVVVVYKKMLP